MMKCADARAFVDAWEKGEGRIDSTSVDEFGRHLESCSVCMREFGGLLPFMMRDAGAQMTEEPVPRDFVDGVMNAISATRRERARPHRFWPALAAAAAIFIIGIGLGFYFGDRNADTVRVTFMLYAPEAESVQLAGDFTSWDPRDFTLKKVDGGGMWEIQVPLQRGRVYVYNFVINGSRWIPDPKATGIVDDGFGGSSSLLIL